MDKQYDQLFKLLIIGDSGVGKSSLLMRYTEDSFSENYICTIGVDFKVKNITVDNQRVKLQVWDTAGQDRFRTITSTYYRGAHGVIIVYDVNDVSSFLNVERWMAEAQSYAETNIARILVGNKDDIPDRKMVAVADAKRLAEEKGCLFFETSARNNTNVNETFDALTKEVLRITSDRKKAAQDTGTLTVRHPEKRKKTKGKCC